MTFGYFLTLLINLLFKNAISLSGAVRKSQTLSYFHLSKSFLS